MTKTIHFKTKQNYLKWTAYGHIHNAFHPKAGGVKVVIRGRVHKVKHRR